MNRKYFIPFFISSLLLYCQKSEQQLWQEASQKNTASSYQNYLKHFSNGKFVELAKLNRDHRLYDLHIKAYGLMSNDKDSAEIIYKSILDINPSDALALNNLAWLAYARYMKANKQKNILNEATAYLEKASSYVQDERVSVNMLLYVTEDGNLIYAGSPTRESSKTNELKHYISHNLEKLQKISSQK